MRLGILETTGEFDIAGYTALESVPYDRPALANLDSSSVQNQIALKRLTILIDKVDESLTSDEAFFEAWSKAEGETTLERAQMALLIAVEDAEKAAAEAAAAEAEAAAETEEKAKKPRTPKVPTE